MLAAAVEAAAVAVATARTEVEGGPQAECDSMQQHNKAWAKIYDVWDETKAQ